MFNNNEATKKKIPNSKNKHECEKKVTFPKTMALFLVRTSKGKIHVLGVSFFPFTKSTYL